MTDSHENDDPAGLDTLLVDATTTAAATVRTATRTDPASDDHDSTVEPPADVAPELHEVEDA
jgi:hypothetical protein